MTYEFQMWPCQAEAEAEAEAEEGGWQALRLGCRGGQCGTSLDSLVSLSSYRWCEAAGARCRTPPDAQGASEPRAVDKTSEECAGVHSGRQVVRVALEVFAGGGGQSEGRQGGSRGQGFARSPACISLAGSNRLDFRVFIGFRVRCCSVLRKTHCSLSRG